MNLNNWKRAYDLVKDANELRFVGYSLPITDSYFRYFLASVLKDSHFTNKKFSVINYGDNNNGKKKYYNYFNFKFEDYIQNKDLYLK